jgi:hypothetical protein
MMMMIICPWQQKEKKTHTHTEKPKQKVVDVSICMEFVKFDFNDERIFFR